MTIKHNTKIVPLISNSENIGRISSMEILNDNLQKHKQNVAVIPIIASNPAQLGAVLSGLAFGVYYSPSVIVTAPYKKLFYTWLGNIPIEAAPTCWAEDSDSANILTMKDHMYVYDNTEAIALSIALEAAHVRSSVRRPPRVIILGYGSLGHSAVTAVAHDAEMFSELEVFTNNRTITKEHLPLLHSLNESVRIHHNMDEITSFEFQDGDVFINCTPIGYNPEDRLAVDLSKAKDLYVIDNVHTRVTELVAAAKNAGHMVCPGNQLMAYSTEKLFHYLAEDKNIPTSWTDFCLNLS